MSVSQFVLSNQHRACRLPVLLNITNNTIGKKESWFTFRESSTYRGKCPFKTLGVAKDIDYNSVKKTFLKLAMTYHPDTNKTNADGSLKTDSQKSVAVDKFMRVRTAFEQIIEVENGRAGLKSDEEGDDGDFDSWFYEETGHNVPDPFEFKLDAETLKEVAESQGQAGLDRGGMWAMASMVTHGLSSGGGPILKLEQGDLSSSDGSKIRRRRRRGGR